MSNSPIPSEFGDCPTKVVFSDLPGNSTVALALYNQIAGEVSSFLQKARQNRIISGQTSSYMVQSRADGGSFRYQYNNGQESVFVRLSPPELAEAHGEPPPKEKTPWDTILVELHILGMATTGAHMGAWVVPQKPDLPQYATTDGDTAGSTLLSFAIEAKTIAATTNSSEWFGSLKIDITQLRGSPTLKVDIHGYIDKPPPPIATLAAWVLHPYTIPHHVDFTDFDIEVFQPVVVQLFNGYTRDQVNAEYPEIAGIPDDPGTNDTLTARSIPVTGGSQTVTLLGETNILNYFKQFGGDYSLVIENWSNGVPRIRREHGTQWFVVAPGPQPPSIPGLPEGFANGVTYSLNGVSLDSYFLPGFSSGPTLPNSLDGTLSTLFYRQGDPLNEASKFRAANETFAVNYRWESAAIYPRRASMNIEPQPVPVAVMLPPASPTPDNRFGMPKLGTFEFDLDHATAKWKPA